MANLNADIPEDAGAPPAQPAVDLQAQIMAAATAVAAAQQAALLAPPPGLAVFPLEGGNPLGDSFLTCGIDSDRAQFALYRTEGLDTFEAFIAMDIDKVQDLASSMARRTQAQGGYRLSMAQTLNIKAMIWWLKDLRDRNQPIGAAFTPIDLAKAKAELASYEETVKNPPSLDRPEKFPVGKKDQWVTWWESVKNYLAATYGVRRRSLLYVVRSNIIPVNPTEEQVAMYQVNLTGPQYKMDNATVYTLLKSLTLDTTAYPWIDQFDRTRDGRAAALALMAQNEGDAQQQTRFAVADAELESIHYKGNEAVFPFSLYASRLQNIFTTMYNAGRPKTEREKVDYLIKKMDIDHNPKLLYIKMGSHQKYPADFTACVADIQTGISNYVTTSTAGTKSRGRLVSEAGTGSRKHQKYGERGGRGRGWRGGRGRGRGRDGRGRGRGRGRDDQSQASGGSGLSYNGVDLNNVNRVFSPHEMDLLGRQGQAIMMAQRRSQNDSNTGTGGRGRGGRNINAVDTQSEVSELTEGTGRGGRGGHNGQAFGRENRGRGRGDRI